MATTAQGSKRKRLEDADLSDSEPEQEVLSEDFAPSEEDDSDISFDAPAAVKRKPAAKGGAGSSEAALKRKITSLEAEVASLKAEIARLKGGKAVPALNPAKLAEQAEKTRKNMHKTVKQIMVYRRSMGKHGKSRINVTIPNVTEAQLPALLGDKLYAELAKKKKSGQMKIAGDELCDVLGGRPTASLRYGACLSVFQDEHSKHHVDRN